MRNIRIKFIKDGVSRFISHLDLNRCMTRAIHRSKIPVWYTEGFNPHPFITFASPLSLGMRGRCEFMDMKIVNDISNDDIKDKLNRCMPSGMYVVSVKEPLMNPSDIHYAGYDAKIYSCGIETDIIFDTLNKILNQEEIIVEKKTKSGSKEVNLREYISNYNITNGKDHINFYVLLPTGNKININPNLLLDILYKKFSDSIYIDVSRTELLDINMKIFE